MAAPAKKFGVVRSSAEIVLAEDEQLKRRQERLRCRFTDLAPATCRSNGGDGNAQLLLPSPPPLTRTSSLVASLAKIRDTARHAEVLKDLQILEPLVAAVPVQQTSDKTEAASHDIDSSSNETIPTVIKSSSTNALLISNRQRGNPVIKFIRNVSFEYVEIIPDFVLGRTTCAVFLSLHYHALHPDYIHYRLKLLGKSYELRVLLVQVDRKNPHHSLKDLTKIAVMADCTLLLAWSSEEAAKHLETYKIFENKPPEILMKKQESDSYSKIIDALSSIRTINKSDAASLMATFGTFENIVRASMEDLEICPGMGPKKAKNLHSVLHKPFLK